MSSPVGAAVEAIKLVGGFVPETAAELDSLFKDLPSLHESVAKTLSNLAERFSSAKPVHSTVLDYLRDIAAWEAGLADSARDMEAIYRTAHEHDRARIENPRPGEDLWDVSRNR